MKISRWSNYFDNSNIKLDNVVKDYCGGKSDYFYVSTSIGLDTRGFKTSQTKITTGCTNTSKYSVIVVHKCFDDFLKTIEHAKTGHEALERLIISCSE